MQRPGRGALAESAWDVAPPFRSLWQGLIGLYVPMMGDGRQVPNRAPSSLPALQWRDEANGPPVFSSRGAVMYGPYLSFRANIPPWMLNVIRTSRLAVMWTGDKGDDAGPNSGLFGISPHTYAEPWHTLGFEGSTSYNALTQFGAGGGYANALSVQGIGPSRVAVATRTPGLMRSVSQADQANFVAVSGSIGTDHSYATATTAIEVYAGTRFYPSPESGWQDQVWSMGAVWHKCLSDAELMQLTRDPWALCARWKRSFAGVNFRALRPTGVDVVNSGWSAS
jgi:hypothetical protein